MLVIELVKIILIIRIRVINKSDDEIVKIPVNFRALVLSLNIRKKITVNIMIKTYIKYTFIFLLPLRILQYHKYNLLYLPYK